MATIKGAICGSRYSIGVPQVRPTILPQAVKWYAVWEREAERERKVESIWLRSTMPQLMTKSESPVGFLGHFRLSKLSSNLFGVHKTYAQFAREQTEDTLRYTHSRTCTHTLRTLTRWGDWRKLPLLLLAAAAAENTFAFPFSFTEWKPRTKWPSCASPTRDCALSFTHYSHRHIYTYVCMYVVYTAHTHVHAKLNKKNKTLSRTKHAAQLKTAEQRSGVAAIVVVVAVAVAVIALSLCT